MNFLRLIFSFVLAAILPGCASLQHQTVPDVNYQSFSDVDGLDIPELIVDLPALGIDAANFSDVVKFSHATNIHIGHLVVRTNHQQREQAVDMNRLCSNITIDVLDVDEGLENALTIKGGCTDITVGTLLIHGGTGNCDLELGGYSAESKNRTVRVNIGSVNHDGGSVTSVRVRVGNADWPIINSGPVDKQIAESLALAIYLLFF